MGDESQQQRNHRPPAIRVCYSDAAMPFINCARGAITLNEGDGGHVQPDVKLPMRDNYTRRFWAM